jgi:hypothetical protein
LSRCGAPDPHPKRMIGDDTHDSTDLRDQAGHPELLHYKAPFSFSKHLYRFLWRSEAALNTLKLILAIRLVRHCFASACLTTDLVWWIFQRIRNLITGGDDPVFDTLHSRTVWKDFLPKSCKGA